MVSSVYVARILLIDTGINYACIIRKPRRDVINGKEVKHSKKSVATLSKSDIYKHKA